VFVLFILRWTMSILNSLIALIYHHTRTMSISVYVYCIMMVIFHSYDFFRLKDYHWPLIFYCYRAAVLFIALWTGWINLGCYSICSIFSRLVCYYTRQNIHTYRNYLLWLHPWFNYNLRQRKERMILRSYCNNSIVTAYNWAVDCRNSAKKGLEISKDT